MLIIFIAGLGQNHCLMMKLNLIEMLKEKIFLNTPDNSDIGYFIEVDLKNPDIIKY